MDTVDAQVHIGPGGIEQALAVMDAVGIRGALIDEYWFGGAPNRPSHGLPGGGYRVVAPTGELAAQLHPDRFSYLLRVHPADPELAAVVRLLRDAPGGRALRVDPGMTAEGRRTFAEGGYDPVFAAAGDAGLPVFVFNPDQPDAIARMAAAFPATRIVVDHVGLFSNAMRAGIGGGQPPLGPEAQIGMFDRVLGLARHANVALKWAHADAMFGLPVWPGDALWPFLRRAIAALGAERVMWASDFSTNQTGGCLAQILYGAIADPALTPAERDLVFGGSLRAWLDWPASA